MNYSPRMRSFFVVLVLSSLGPGYSSRALCQPCGVAEPCTGAEKTCGKWSEVLNFPFAGGGIANIAVMRTGDVLLIYGGDTSSNVRRFNAPYEQGTYGRVHKAAVEKELFCGSHVQLDDGRILFVGGGDSREVTLIYDPDATPPEPSVPPDDESEACPSCFLQVDSELPWPRYYPSVTMHANGKVVANGGGPRTPTLFDPQAPAGFEPSLQWQTLTGATHCNVQQTDCTGAEPPASLPYGLVVHYYPLFYLMPDATLMYVGGAQSSQPIFSAVINYADSTWILDVTGPTPSPGASRWSILNSSPGADRLIAGVASAMYDVGKVMQLGGGDINGNATDCDPYTFDATIPSSGWQSVATPFNNRKSNSHTAMHYLVTLPDGTLFSTGDREVPEIYDPVINSWQEMAPSEKIPYPPFSPVPRGWHSVAALLPDARVFIAGGQPGGDPIEDTGQVFAPPYLFTNNNTYIDPAHAARPKATPPLVIATGNVFTATNVSAGQGANSIDKVALIRPASVTHAVDFDARYIPIEPPCSIEYPCIDSTGPQVHLQAPSSAEVAPPGHYMFFVVNNKGTPSVATFVQVWGVLNTSIDGQVTQGCAGTTSKIFFDVSWETSVPTTAADTLEVCPPPGTCHDACPNKIIMTALPDANDGRKHRVVVSALCQPGNWCYRIKSNFEGSSSPSPWMPIGNVSCPDCQSCQPDCEEITE